MQRSARQSLSLADFAAFMLADEPGMARSLTGSDRRDAASVGVPSGSWQQHAPWGSAEAVWRFTCLLTETHTPIRSSRSRGTHVRVHAEADLASVHSRRQARTADINLVTPSKRPRLAQAPYGAAASDIDFGDAVGDDRFSVDMAPATQFLAAAEPEEEGAIQGTEDAPNGGMGYDDAWGRPGSAADAATVVSAAVRQRDRALVRAACGVR